MATSPAPARSGLFLIYAAIVVSTFAVALDFASIDLALAPIEKLFHLSFDTVQWVINGYVLAFAVFMVAGGKLADAYGRRKVFLIGMSLFLVASLLGGAAWSGGAIITFRVLQGLGAAFLWPAMIGMACGTVSPDRRPIVLGLIFGTCSIGNSVGPVMGGALTQWLSWRWVLWINVPMALLALVLTYRAVPADRPTSGGPSARNDYAGMFTLTGGLVALMLTVYQSVPWGWTDPRVWGLGILAVASLGAFPWIERRAPGALIPPEIVTREFVVLCLDVFLICQLLFVVLLYETQYGLKFLGQDPVTAGARVVQFMLSYGAISYFGGPLMVRFGVQWFLIGGLIAAAIAAALLGLAGPDASWLPYNGSLILLGFGVGAVTPAINARAIESVGQERASLVSGVIFMCQLAGSALMLAINSVIFNFVSNRTFTSLCQEMGFTPSTLQRQFATQVLDGARVIHQPLPVMRKTDVLPSLINQSYQAGLQTVMWLGAALLIIALILTLRYVPARAAKSAST